jgi:hypothetical protein
MRPDDARKGFWVGAKIVDDNEWKKVEAGVYTGFSVGGKYVRRWPDSSRPGAIRYTAMPSELSLVDAPCIPSATFQMVKDGVTTTVAFAAGNGVDVLTWEAEDELSKAGNLPSVPESAATINAGKDLTYDLSIDVERLPDPFATLVVVPGSEPSQAELQAAAANSKDMAALADEWMSKIPEMVKAAVREVLAEELQKATTPTPANPVTRFIKVIKKENTPNG